jgi:hypothetical protein
MPKAKIQLFFFPWDRNARKDDAAMAVTMVPSVYDVISANR